MKWRKGRKGGIPKAGNQDFENSLVEATHLEMTSRMLES